MLVQFPTVGIDKGHCSAGRRQASPAQRRSPIRTPTAGFFETGLGRGADGRQTQQPDQLQESAVQIGPDESNGNHPPDARAIPAPAVSFDDSHRNRKQQQSKYVRPGQEVHGGRSH